MSITQWPALAFLLFACACASNPGEKSLEQIDKKPLKGALAEFKVISYDGRILKGRLLLGATIDPVVVDGRLFEWIDVGLENIRECAKTEALKHWVYEAIPQAPREDELIRVQPGYWYGVNLNYLLFQERATGLGPACFEAEVVVLAVDGRVAAKVPIRVMRSDQALNPSVPSAEEPKAAPPSKPQP